MRCSLVQLPSVNLGWGYQSHTTSGLLPVLCHCGHEATGASLASLQEMSSTFQTGSTCDRQVSWRIC